MEEEEGDKIEYVPLSQRTRLAKVMEEERIRISTLPPPSIPKEPIQVTTSEDEEKIVDCRHEGSRDRCL